MAICSPDKEKATALITEVPASMPIKTSRVIATALPRWPAPTLRSCRLQPMRDRGGRRGIEHVKVGGRYRVRDGLARLRRNRLVRNRDEEFPRCLHRQMALIAEPLIGDNARDIGAGAQSHGMRTRADHSFVAPSDRAANALRQVGSSEIECWAIFNFEAHAITVADGRFEDIHWRLANECRDE